MRQPNEETEERLWQHIAARKRGTGDPPFPAENAALSAELAEMIALADAVHETLSEKIEPVTGEAAARAKLTALIDQPVGPPSSPSRPETTRSHHEQGWRDPSRRRPLLLLMVLLLLLLVCLAIGYQRQRSECAPATGTNTPTK